MGAINSVQRLMNIALTGPKVNPMTGTRASVVTGNSYLAKIVLPGKGNSQAQKLGITRIIKEFLPNGTSNIIVDLKVPCSLNGGWGGQRTLQGTAEQIKKTFQYLNKSVNENCNTIKALDGLQQHIFKLFPNLKNIFANIK